MHAMRCFAGRLVPIVASFAAVLCTFPSQSQDSTPWSLRDHYSFSSERATFSYDVKTAEWKVDVEGIGTIVDHVTAEVVLADRKVVPLAGAQYLGEERTKFADALGNGTNFRSQFQTRFGLAFRYTVARYTEHPFLTFSVEIANVGQTPLEIAAIRPAVLRREDVQGLIAAERTRGVQTRHRGRYPVVHNAAAASLIPFRSGATSVLGLGVLQTGRAESAVIVRDVPGSERAYVETRFDPPLYLGPKRSFKADPVWISFGIDNEARVRQLHARAQSMLPGPEQGGPAPKAWVTVDSDISARNLYKAVRRWRGENIKHALVPADWQSSPGLLRGASPEFPDNMREVVKQIRRMGLSPGIAVDPLIVRGGSADWTYAVQRGAQWIDVAHPDARAYAAERAEQIADWGFDFFVVHPSDIPDSVLKHFGVTRTQADHRAFEILAEAAKGKPVLPSSGLSLGTDIEAWRSVVEMTTWYPEYGVVPGPVTLRADSKSTFSLALADVLHRFQGPIELIGTPTNSFRKKLNDALSSRELLVDNSLPAHIARVPLR